MKFIAILLFSLLSISVCISQNWNGHYSYHNSIDTSTGNGKIFTASENAIYIYRKYGFIEVPVEANSPYQRSDIKMELVF